MSLCARAESDILADESNGPRPSCSSFEKLARLFSSVRSTAVRMRLSVSWRWRFRRSIYTNSLWRNTMPTDMQNDTAMSNHTIVITGMGWP